MFKFAGYLVTTLALGTARLVAQLQPLPDLDNARVSIPYAELKSLWQAAHPDRSAVKAKPPVAATLLSARYQMALQPEYADVVAEFETQSFSEEWNIVPLLGAEAQIASVEPADAQLVLRDGRYALITNAIGKTKLKLRFSVRLTGTEHAQQLRFAAAPAFINILNVTGVPENRSLRVPDATLIDSGKGTASFRLTARDQLDVQLAAAKQSGPPVPSQWKVEAQSFVQLAEGKLVYQTRLVARADAGSGLDLALRLPAAANVLRVKGDDLADWQARTAEDRSRLIQIRWQTRDVLSREIEIGYELPQPATPGEWKLASPLVEGGETVNALYAIVGEDGLELTPSAAAPLPARLPRWLAENAGSHKFAIVGSNGTLQAKWLPLIATSPATIERAQATMRVVADGSLLNEMVYSIRYETPLAWQLRLPAGSELLSCSIDGRQANPIDRGEGVIEFPLAVSDRKYAAEVKLSYTARKPAFKPVSGQVKIDLPRTELLIHRLEWELRIPAVYEIAAMEGNVESAGGGGQPEGGSRVIRLRKELCKAETPEAELFYQKPDTQK